jgi:hypothetical protein
VISASRSDAFLRRAFFWHFDTTLPGRARLALAAYVGLWVLLTLRNYVARRGIRNAAVLCGLLAAVVGSSATVTRWQDRSAPAGVVTALDVVVYKGPGTGYQRQFEQPLQPGVEFTLRERRGGWWSILLPDGNTGWIDAGSAALVPLGET